MSDIDPAALVEITSEVVSAYLVQNHIPAAEIPTLIASIHRTFSELGKELQPTAEPEKLTPAVPIKKSVTDEYLISLEDGKRYKSLKRHLAGHGLTPAEYRVKWGLPGDYPMIAPAYARQRSELAKTIGLGSMRKKG